MIVRICKGWTRPDDRDAYASYVTATGIAATPLRQATEAPTC